MRISSKTKIEEKKDRKIKARGLTKSKKRLTKKNKTKKTESKLTVHN